MKQIARKLLPLTWLFAMIAIAACMTKPVYAGEGGFNTIEIEGTDEWDLSETFSASYTATSDPEAYIDCVVGLSDENDNLIYNTADGTGSNLKVSSLDKNVTYHLHIWLHPFSDAAKQEDDFIYIDSVSNMYFNGKKIYQSSSSPDFWVLTNSETTVKIVKEVKYEPLTGKFMATFGDRLDLGEVKITGPESYKVGDVFDGTAFKVTSSKVNNLKVKTILRDQANKITYYDSVDQKDTVKLEKGKIYRRLIIVDFPDDYHTIGDIDKLTFNGRVYENISNANYYYEFGVDRYGLIINELINYYSTTDDVRFLPTEPDFGIINIEGTADWYDGETYAPDFKAVSSEGFKMNVHTRLIKDGKFIYDSATPSTVKIEEGKEYKVQVLLSIPKSDLEGDMIWFGNVDAVQINKGNSIKNFHITDDSNTLEFTYEFTAGKTRPKDPTLDPSDPGKDPSKPGPAVSGKKAQPAAISAKGKNLKTGKKGQKLKNLITVKDAKGKVTYKITNAKQKKQFKINNKGIISLKKKLKKGTYKLKVEVTVAGDDQYEALTKTVTVKIKVKK